MLLKGQKKQPDNPTKLAFRLKNIQTRCVKSTLYSQKFVDSNSLTLNSSVPLSSYNNRPLIRSTNGIPIYPKGIE